MALSGEASFNCGSGGMDVCSVICDRFLEPDRAGLTLTPRGEIGDKNGKTFNEQSPLRCL